MNSKEGFERHNVRGYIYWQVNRKFKKLQSELLNDPRRIRVTGWLAGNIDTERMRSIAKQIEER